MSNAPPGGPATINGVLYQSLWSLLRAVRVHIQEVQLAPDSAIEKTRLVLEPCPGGGDLQVNRGAARIVEQLKACREDDTWPLTDIVREVLPDLYVAYDPARPETEYRFVTEGRMGRWDDAYDFFRGLRQRTWDEQAGLDGLDDGREIAFQRGPRTLAAAPGDPPPFWPLPRYTERTLFERVVEEVRKRRVISKREDEAATRRGVWHLLGRFEFAGEHTLSKVRQEVNSLLLAIIARDAGLDEKRQALLAGLLEEASKGSAAIDSKEFLGRYQLDSVPLTNWSLIRENARRHLDCVLRRLGYCADEDVRRETALSLVRGWRSSALLLALVGESGVGKSWELYALAQACAGEEALVVLLAATGDADRDCQRAANTVWRTFKNQDDGIPLERIAHRRRALLHSRAERWLTLLVDNVVSATEVRQLVDQPWEEWGVRVALTCSPEVARTFAQEANPSHRWILLDGVIDLADPGDDHAPTPEWLRQVYVMLSPEMRSHLQKRIEKRRKEIAEDLKRRSPSERA